MSSLLPPRFRGTTRSRPSRLIAALLLALLVAGAVPLPPSGAADGPQVALSSYEGPCGARPEVRGTGWVPGATVYVSCPGR